MIIDIHRKHSTIIYYARVIHFSNAFHCSSMLDGSLAPVNPGLRHEWLTQKTLVRGYSIDRGCNLKFC